MAGESYDFSMIVIGSGPAGESAAMNSVKRGKRCAMVETHSRVGGNCTHRGTIPSKALRQSVKQLLRFTSHPLLSNYVHPRSYSFPNLRTEMNKVVQRQVDMRSRFYSRNGIHRITGQARFIDGHTVAVTQPDGSEEKITAQNIVIATGSRPYQPADIDFNHPRIYDSDSILEMDHTPRKLLIYGAGVIGCEYASIFSGLGMKVDLINSRDNLLEFLDDETTDKEGIREYIHYYGSFIFMDSENSIICIHNKNEIIFYALHLSYCLWQIHQSNHQNKHVT